MNASASYAEYAKKAQNKSVAALFKAASAAEALHAKLLNDMALSSKLSTKSLTAKINAIKTGTDVDNLKSGIAGETYEYTKMYPAFSKVAASENNKNVAELMNRIASVEKTHAELYNKTIQDLNAKKTLPTVYIYALFADMLKQVQLQLNVHYVMLQLVLSKHLIN